MKLFLIALALLCLTSPASAKDYKFADLVTAITIPDSWHIIGNKEYDAHLKAGADILSHEQLDAFYRAYAEKSPSSEVIIAAAKRNTKDMAGNASLQVLQMKTPSFDMKKGRDWLTATLARRGRKLAIQEPTITKIDGKGFHTLNFTIQQSDYDLEGVFYMRHNKGFNICIMSIYADSKDKPVIETIVQSVKLFESEKISKKQDEEAEQGAAPKP